VALLVLMIAARMAAPCVVAGRVVSAGTLGLTVDLDARGGAVTGTLTPSLADVSVLGATEMDIRHPLRELLVERRLKRRVDLLRRSFGLVRRAEVVA